MRRRRFGENMGRSPAAKTARNANSASKARRKEKRSAERAFTAVSAAVRANDEKWQQFNDANLSELARQKAYAERRAQEADATLRRVFDGTRHAMHTAARLADAAKEGNKIISKTGEAASAVLRSAA